jgi:hypothetical protein
MVVMTMMSAAMENTPGLNAELGKAPPSRTSVCRRAERIGGKSRRSRPDAASPWTATATDVDM